MPGAPTGTIFLAVPTMLGAAVFDLYKNRAILSLENGTMIAIGLVVAFICALFVVRALVGFVSRHGFRRLRLVPHRSRQSCPDVVGPVALSGCDRIGSWAVLP
jgi:hypothetical protein